jgi:hypothetical protein
LHHGQNMEALWPETCVGMLLRIFDQALMDSRAEAWRGDIRAMNDWCVW